MTRREFIWTLGSATLVAGCELEDVERLVDDARTEVRLGVLAQTEIGWKESTGRLKKAFEFYRQEGVDAVVIAGGATANGHRDQLDVLRAAWTGVFGRTDKVRLILDEGRHEVGGFAFAVSRRCPVEKGDGLTFHAQGKKPLTNDLWFYDPEMRAVYAGSMNGVVVQAGYEFDGRLSDGKMTVPAAQGLLVSVYSSRIAIRRLDFTQSALPEGEGRLRQGVVYAEDVAEALVLDRATLQAEDSPAVPEFWDDTQLKSFNGYAGAKRIVTLRWPHVLKRFRGARAARYEVGVHVWPQDGSALHAPFVRRYVLSKGFHLSEARDLEAVSCVFDGGALEATLKQHASLAISVTPVSSRGLRGKPICIRLSQ